MLNFILKFFLILSSTGWMVAIYWIKEVLDPNTKLVCSCYPSWMLIGIPILLPVLLSCVSFFFFRCLDVDEVSKCKELILADSEGVSVYLGYFFVAVGVSDWRLMAIIYVFVFLYAWLSKAQYFNPVFMLFGYHYYHVTTEKGTHVYVISKGAVKRCPDEGFGQLARINDTTFIER